METAAVRPPSPETLVETTISPLVILRVAGLPIEAVETLRMERATAWAESVLAVEDELERLSEPLVEEVFAAIGGQQDQGLRRRLIQLKREVFNRRYSAPFDEEEAEAVRAALSSRGRELLTAWSGLAGRLGELLVAGGPIYAEEIARKRRLLKEAVTEPDFLKGLLLASPQLGQGSRRYLASDEEALDRRARLAERSLYQYLQRTGCKTSPFSTFTAVTSGSFDHSLPAEARIVEYRAEDMAKSCFVRLDVRYLARLAARLGEHLEIRASLPVQLVAGWSLTGGKLRYLRRTEGELRSKEALVNPLHENVLRLPTGTLMSRLIELLAGERRIAFGDLADELSDGDERIASDVERYLAHLLRLGVLVHPDLRIDVHSPDPLRVFRHALARLDHPVPRAVAELLAEIEERLGDLPTAPVERRAGLIAEIRDLLGDSFAAVGAPDEEVEATPLFEDTVLSPRSLRLNAKRLAGVLDDLAEVQVLASVFDFNLPRRLALKGFFRARFPAGARVDDLLKFAEEFHHDFFEQYAKRSLRRGGLDAEGRLIGAENALKMPEIDALNQARQEIADSMTELNRQRGSEDRELVLDRRKLREILASLPLPEPLQAHSFFCQLGIENAEPLLTVNRVYAGFGLLFSRFAHFLDHQQEGFLDGLRQALRQVQPPGAVFAELQGGYDATNLNLHPVVTDYELECPGDVSTRPPEERIPLSDLSIQHDVRDDSLRLYSRRLGAQVIPVYLGFLLPMALPEIQQVLLNFAFLPLCPLAVWTGAETASADEGVARYPRVRCGRVVIEREMWKVRPDDVPCREPQEDEASFFLRVQRWVRRHRIPDRVYVTPDSLMGRGGLGNAGRDSYKPLYVDFRDPFALSLLEQTARRSKDRLVLKEMLPHRDHLWLQREEGTFVTELVVESYRRVVDHV